MNCFNYWGRYDCKVEAYLKFSILNGLEHNFG